MLDQKFRLRMKSLEVICSYLTRSWTHVFVIVKMNAFGIDGDSSIRFVLHFEQVAAGTPLLSFLEDCYLV